MLSRGGVGGGEGPSRLTRLAEWLLPWSTRALRGPFFRHGVGRRACRAIHRAAARGTLWAYAPPPPVVLVATAGRGAPADLHRFRAPFGGAGRDAFLRHYHCGAAGRPLVLVNPGTSSVAPLVERLLARRLRALGVDVAVPLTPLPGRQRSGARPVRDWAATVGRALRTIAALTHANVAIEAWARQRGYGTVVVGGVGVGGTAVALLAATTTRFDAYVPMLAGAHPGRLWLPPRALARAVHRRALARTGVRSERALARLFDPVAPCRLPPPRRRLRCTLVGLRFDTLVPPADVQDLAAHWRVVPRWLPRCHVELPVCTAELAAILARAATAASA